MAGEKNLKVLLKNMKPELNKGDYVFCTVKDIKGVQIEDIVMFFREADEITLILLKETADRIGLEYTYVAAWITLSVHSSLEAVGLTAAFSHILAHNEISCNVIAGYYHDHIFVDKRDTDNALTALKQLSQSGL